MKNNNGEDKMQLAKFKAQALGPHTPKARKPITVKKVVILDTDDGAFVDESVKIKPCIGDDRKLVLKCTDLPRLFETMKRLGLTLAGKPTKGRKHYIAFVWKAQTEKALAGQAALALEAETAKPVKALSGNFKMLVKGGVA